MSINKFPLIVRQHFTIKPTKEGFNLTCDDCKNDGNTFASSFSKKLEPVLNTTGIDDLIAHIHRVHPQEDVIAMEEHPVNETTTNAIVPPEHKELPLSEAILNDVLGTPKLVEEVAVPVHHMNTIADNGGINLLSLEEAEKNLPRVIADSIQRDTVRMEAATTLPSPASSVSEMYPNVFKIEKLKYAIISIPVVDKPSFVFNEVKEEVGGKLNVVVRAKDKRHSVIISMKLFDEYLKNKK